MPINGRGQHTLRDRLGDSGLIGALEPLPRGLEQITAQRLQIGPVSQFPLDVENEVPQRLDLQFRRVGVLFRFALSGLGDPRLPDRFGLILFRSLAGPPIISSSASSAAAADGTAMRGLRRHHRHTRSARLTGRAEIGSRRRKRPRSSATACADS